MPVFMHTREVNQRPEVSQSVVCAVQKLQAALERVELEQEVPCTTLTHENIHVLLTKLEALRDYALREEIFNSLASPGHAQTLLLVMNKTLPLIATQVGSLNETEQESSVGSRDSDYESISCVSDFCRNNCSVCVANCGIHQLRRGLADLFILLKADNITASHECKVCVDEGILSEAETLATTLTGITTELLQKDDQCQCVLLSHPHPHCDSIFKVQSWLENMSHWMNESLSCEGGAQSDTSLHEAMEQLNTAVLPQIRRSLVHLENSNCTDLGCVSELPLPSQLAQGVSSVLSSSDCNMELQEVVRLQILDLLHITYSRLVRELLPLYLPN